MLQNQQALVALAKEQNQRAGQLFGTSFPGFNTAEQVTQALATGDPAAIERLTAPAAQSAAQTAAGTKANILATSPAGGEKQLALEAVDVGRGAEVARAATGATTEAPRALAALAGQGIPESTASAGTAISGLSSAEQGLASLGGLQLQSQQIQAEEKGNVLGAVTGLAGAGAELGSAAILAPAMI